MQLNNITIVFSVIIGIFLTVCIWNILKKAGQPGWKALIPIYNGYSMAKIAKATKEFWAVLVITLCFIVVSTLSSVWVALSIGEAVVLIIGLVYTIVVLVCALRIAIKLARAFGKGTGFGIGLIALSVIFYPILAFGDSTYIFNK